MMEKLSKEEYETLYFIYRGRTNFQRLDKIFDKASLKKKVTKLEKLGLIKISYREEEIYGFMESDKGKELIESEVYKNWYRELGD